MSGGRIDSAQTVIEAFTELAPNYETTVDAEIRQMWGIGYRQFVDRLIAEVPIVEGSRVLDVATGTGVIPSEIARGAAPRCEIVGLDITPAMLVRAQASLRDAGLSALVRVVCASGMTMPFPSRAFDVITCGLGMHHMEASQLVQEMGRVLRPGGWLVMADVGASPFWNSLIGAAWFRVILIRFRISHSRLRFRAEVDALANLRTADEWLGFLAAHGFEDIQITALPAIRRFYPTALLIRARAASARRPSESGQDFRSTGA